MNQLSFGEHLRDEGIGRVAENNREWLKRIRGYARWYYDWIGNITIDDLRRWADDGNDHPTHPNAWGAVFKGKEWECIGRKKSTIASNHAREVKVWRLREDK